MVKRSAAASKNACEEKQLDLRLELPTEAMMITGDNQAISQLVDNLIDNAIKYTGIAGSIEIRLSQESEGTLLSVKDSGIGIEPQFQQRIFERFYRVDKARIQSVRGTGLGLSIVKNIAEQHGGSVSVESKPGVGSTFQVTLPPEGNRDRQF